MYYGEIISVSLNINVNSVELNPLILLLFSFDKTMKVGIDNMPLLFTNNYIVFVTNEVKAVIILLFELSRNGKLDFPQVIKI